MSADKEKQFDEMLGRALQEHSEPVPADFTERMLRQINSAEEQRILARVVLQERLSLAGCIVLGIAAAAVVFFSPGIAVSLAEQIVGFIGKVTEGIEALRYDWQFYAVFTGVFGFAVYSLADLFVGES